MDSKSAFCNSTVFFFQEQCCELISDFLMYTDYSQYVDDEKDV